MYPYEIFTDSTGDFTPELVQELEIQVLPMSFTLDGAAYRNFPDNHELSPKAYYDKLRAGSASITSSLNVAELSDAFEPALAAGRDVLYLAFSSGLSGTYQNGCIAMEELRKKYPQRKLECVDTLAASMGEALVVYQAAMLRREGKTLEEVTAWLAENLQRFNSWFTVDDLMFLHRGGRLSGGVAVAGTLLGIKPVLHVDAAGHLVNMEKVRGRRASLDSLVEHYRHHGLYKGSNVVMLSHGDCPEDADYVAQRLKQIGLGKLYLGTIGPVIGAHSGPGTVALFYLGDER